LPADDSQRLVLVYDDDCGFCKWSVARTLAWDRRRRLRPVGLSTPEADRLLVGMSEQEREDSYHVVDLDGTVRSAGAGAPVVLAQLPGGRPLAALATARPGLAEWVYRAISGRRTPLGRLVTAGAGARARRRIAERE
jgi:predicted DCC family thiol-disulfide oxidoreductase YuxK